MGISWIFIYFDNILNIISAIGLLVNLDNKKETSTCKTYTYFSTKDLCCEFNLLRSTEDTPRDTKLKLCTHIIIARLTKPVYG